jgi:alkylated DNA repair dioxygenase AlkB
MDWVVPEEIRNTVFEPYIRIAKISQFDVAGTSQRMYDNLLKECSPFLRRETVEIFGNRSLRQNALFELSNSKFQTKSYLYSNVEHPSHPATPTIAQLISYSNKFAALPEFQPYAPKAGFNRALMNFYSAKANLGAHADSEVGMHSTMIVSFSFGARRAFALHGKVDNNGTLVPIREYKKICSKSICPNGQILPSGSMPLRGIPANLKTTSKKIVLSDGTVLVMIGDCQKMLKHSIPAMTKGETQKFQEDYKDGKGRINITVRSFI